jgi:uncharacterized RDD family membrane protein YckC
MSESGAPPPDSPNYGQQPDPSQEPPSYGQQPPPYGQTPAPQPPPYGQTPEPGQQPGYAPPPYGQQPVSSQPPSYGQPPAYGQPAYGQPAYGQAPYGQAPYGQSPYGQAPYGQSPLPAGVRVASMPRRLGARALDWLILAVILGVIGGIIFGSVAAAGGFDNLDSESGDSADGVFVAAYFGWLFLVLVITLGYEMILIATRGATLGKQIVGIKVVNLADGQSPGWLGSFLRWLIPFVGIFACGIGEYVVYLSPFFDSSGRQQGWHDKVAKTVVIHT